jgi:hypothetical protein
MAGKSVLAWHFCGDKLRDGRPIPRNGVWLKHEGECKMCESGLHASRRLIDALHYAPGNTLCRVECADIAVEQDDKLVCHRRRIIARFDATDLLPRAARKFALDVIHLWDAPPVVVKFLKTGDESLRAAAWDAAWDARAAWDAARAVRDAAGDAAGAAWDAWDAARAARDAAGDAARAVRDAQNKWLTREALKILRKQENR